MPGFMRGLSGLFAGCAVALAATAACAQNAETYPTRPIHFIVGFSAGGGTDVLARLIAQKLQEKFNQPIVVDDRPGADGSIAADIIAHAPPDGYNIAVITNAHTITPNEYKLNYDPVKSFAPVLLIGSIPDILLINPAVPAKTLPELIAVLKANPGKYNFASSGTGTSPFLAMQLLKNMTGTDIVSIPFKGSEPATVALLGGDVQMMFGAVSTTQAQVKAGKLRALAVSSAIRSPAVPDIPTVAEAGNLPGFEASTWYGFLAPANTPKPIVDKLNAAMVEVIRAPEMQQKFLALGCVTIASTPDEFTQRIKNDITRWAEIMKTVKVN